MIKVRFLASLIRTRLRFLLVLFLRKLFVGGPISRLLFCFPWLGLPAASALDPLPLLGACLFFFRFLFLR